MTSRPTNPIADILDRAADLIEPEGAWTQNYFALNGEGEEVDPNRLSAVCFCARGAIYHALKKNPLKVTEDEAVRVFAPLVKAIGADSYYGIETWNDDPSRTQSEVVSKLREAASLARKEVGV